MLFAIGHEQFEDKWCSLRGFPTILVHPLRSVFVPHEKHSPSSSSMQWRPWGSGFLVRHVCKIQMFPTLEPVFSVLTVAQTVDGKPYAFLICLLSSFACRCHSDTHWVLSERQMRLHLGRVENGVLQPGEKLLIRQQWETSCYHCDHNCGLVFWSMWIEKFKVPARYCNPQLLQRCLAWGHESWQNYGTLATTHVQICNTSQVDSFHTTHKST